MHVHVTRAHLYFPIVHLLDFLDNSVDNRLEGTEEVQKQDQLAEWEIICGRVHVLIRKTVYPSNERRKTRAEQLDR